MRPAIRYNSGWTSCWSAFGADIDEQFSGVVGVEAASSPMFTTMKGRPPCTEVIFGDAQEVCRRTCFTPGNREGNVPVDIPALIAMLAASREPLCTTRSMSDSCRDCGDGPLRSPLANTRQMHRNKVAPTVREPKQTCGGCGCQDDGNDGVLDAECSPC